MLAGVGRTTQNEIWLYGSKGTLHLDLDAKKLSIALQEAGESDFCLRSWTLVCTAAVKSLHPNMCIAVHCSILLHPQLPWYRESAHHWELRDQV